MSPISPRRCVDKLWECLEVGPKVKFLLVCFDPSGYSLIRMTRPDASVFLAATSGTL